MSSDTRELEKLIIQMRTLPRDVRSQAHDILTHSSKRIVSDWRLRWQGHPHIPHLPRAITFDVNERDPGVFTAEIGPDKHRALQGRLGSFIEFGTRTSGPIPGGLPAAAAEEPHLIREVERIRILGG